MERKGSCKHVANLGIYRIKIEVKIRIKTKMATYHAKKKKKNLTMWDTFLLFVLLHGILQSSRSKDEKQQGFETVSSHR